MSLDLFFAPTDRTRRKLQSKSFLASADFAERRSALITAMRARFPEARVVESGHADPLIEDFPIGELQMTSLLLSWSMHGDGRDPDVIHQIIDWFEAQGYACEDPQDSGFSTRARKALKSARMMRHWDELDGSRLRALSLDVAAEEAELKFSRPDGSLAVCTFMVLDQIVLPQPLDGVYGKTVRQVTVNLDASKHRFTDEYRFAFTETMEIVVRGIHKYSHILPE